LYGTAMPARLRRSLIIQALAYRLQEKAFGGLKPATRRLLETAAGGASEHRTAKLRTRRSAQTGTVLVREWHGDLLRGRAHSMVDISKREKVGKRYVSRVIRFAFLAPNIVEQIAGDRQLPDFTAESLLRGQAELPLAWDAQRKLLGFSSPA
jgi:hypothetical protein